MKDLKNLSTVILGLVCLMAVPFTAMGETKNEKDAGETPSPLSSQIGGVKLKLGGNVNGMFFFRDVNTSSGLATNFAQFPFSNTLAYYDTESRLTAFASVFNLTAMDQFDGSDIKAYLETDFLGNDAANLYVTANSSTLRLRQYWVDMKKGPVEFTVGQAYSLLTPGRKGISPENRNIFLTYNLDPSFQLGLVWTRAMQFRVAFHADSDLTLGLSLENPDLYGGMNEVTFPSAYNVLLGFQIDEGGSSTAPNVIPDVIGKLALDSGDLHLEAAGLLSEFNVDYLLTGQGGTNIPGPPFDEASAWGFGAELNLSLGSPDFRLVATNFYSYGGGRYMDGLGPDFVIHAEGGPLWTLSIQPVVSFGGVYGVETELSPDTRLAGYFGFAQFDPSYQVDDTASLPNRYDGFGGPNSSNGDNHYMREFTLDFSKDIWKTDAHGTLQWGIQYSFVSRTPDFVAAGAPAWADGNMLFTNVKYILP